MSPLNVLFCATDNPKRTHISFICKICQLETKQNTFFVHLSCFFSQKCQTFAGSRLLNLWICSYSLSSKTVNEELLVHTSDNIAWLYTGAAVPNY